MGTIRAVILTRRSTASRGTLGHKPNIIILKYFWPEARYFCDFQAVFNEGKLESVEELCPRDSEETGVCCVKANRKSAAFVHTEEFLHLFEGCASACASVCASWRASCASRASAASRASWRVLPVLHGVLLVLHVPIVLVSTGLQPHTAHTMSKERVPFPLTV